MAGSFQFAAWVVLVLLAGQKVEGLNIALGLARTALDARTSGVNTLDEIEGESILDRAVRWGVGFAQFQSTQEVCEDSATGLLRACMRQYTYLVSQFGTPGLGRLFPPGFTEDMLTAEFLEGLPAPNARCCSYAVTFQSNFCACEENIILAFRNFGYFDPSLTMPFANYLYGTYCGAPTFLGDDCPNGNPF